MFVLWGIGALIFALTLLVGQTLFNKLSADYRHRADKEFYEYSTTVPFTNDIYVRQLRKFQLVSPAMTYEKFDYVGKKAVNGIPLGVINYSRRTPFRIKKTSDTERVVKVANRQDDSIEKDIAPVYSIQKQDPLLDLPTGESGVKKGDMVLT